MKKPDDSVIERHDQIDAKRCPAHVPDNFPWNKTSWLGFLCYTRDRRVKLVDSFQLRWNFLQISLALFSSASTRLLYGNSGSGPGYSVQQTV